MGDCSSSQSDGSRSYVDPVERVTWRGCTSPKPAIAGQRRALSFEHGQISGSPDSRGPIGSNTGGSSGSGSSRSRPNSREVRNIGLPWLRLTFQSFLSKKLMREEKAAVESRKAFVRQGNEPLNWDWPKLRANAPHPRAPGDCNPNPEHHKLPQHALRYSPGSSSLRTIEKPGCHSHVSEISVQNAVHR